MGSHMGSARAPRASGFVRFMAGMVVTILALVVFLGVSALALQQRYSGRVAPGVWVAGIPLEGLTASQAEAAINRGWAEAGPRYLTLQDGDRQWVLSLADLGVSWDAPATVRAAMRLGSTGSLLGDWDARLRGWQQGMSVAPVWRLDTARCDQALRGLAQIVDRPAQEATFTLQGSAPRSTPAVVGRELDVTATRERLSQALRTGLPATLELVVKPLQPTVTDGEAARQRAEQLLSRQVTVVFSDGSTQRTWALGHDLVASCLVPKQVVGADGKAQWTFDIKSDPVAQWIANIASEVDCPTIEGRVTVDDRTMLATMTTPSQTGRQVDQAEALKLVMAALQGGSESVQLPVKLTPPPVTEADVAKWGKLTLLSTGTSGYKGSDAGRKQNIDTGASRFEGVIVAPGETFSFAKYVGLTTLAEGWAEALVIVGDRTEMGAGGGICQVATTMFRAAFYGGFPIVKRVPHTYRVGWYEPPVGLDATVYTPYVDFQFKNDLGFPIVMEAVADNTNGVLTFKFYGPGNLGRTVTMDGPKITNQKPAPPPVYVEDDTLDPGQIVQTDLAHDGLTATIVRNITKADGSVTHDTFVSTYEPWPARYLKGPDPNKPPQEQQQNNP